MAAIRAAITPGTPNRSSATNRPARQRGGGDVELGLHQDRGLAGEQVADDSAGAGGHHAHREGGDRGDSEAQGLGRAVGRVSGEAGGVEPDQGPAAPFLLRGQPHAQSGEDADQQGPVGVDPEHRCADQQVADGAAADTGNGREEDERDDGLLFLRGEEGARDREHRNSEIIDQLQGLGQRCGGHASLCAIFAA